MTMTWKLPAYCLLAGTAILTLPATAENFTPDQITFFETKVRPVLVENCYGCHSASKQNNGLRLDGREFILKGSDYGPVVVPGNIEGSKLIHAVRQDGGMSAEAMPKEKPKLSAAAIADLSEWIQQGLPWPNETPPALTHTTPDPRKHWAFQPVVAPALPEVKQKELVYQPLDAFVLAKLEAQGLTLSPKIERGARLRRLYVDLLGFPPTFEQVQAFISDKAPDAYMRQVDALLKSPHFGERWGRYWLDIARYADTKGYVFQEERRYPFAYTYRDWVIRALNADMPFDEFLRHQIAADQINPPEHKENLAALGFLTLGRRFLNAEPDIIDDRLDVIFRGTQAMTVGCARCHDHKFDPIPTADYYSLYGVLASSMEPKDLPELPGVERTPEVEKFEADLKAKEAKIPEYRQERHAEMMKPEAMEKYLLGAMDAAGKQDEEIKKLAKERGIYLPVLQRWKKLLEQGNDAMFGLWQSGVKVPVEKFAEQFSGVINAADAAQKFSPVVLQAIKQSPPKNREELAKAYARMFAEAPGKPDYAPLKDAIMAPEGPMGVKPEELEPFFTRNEVEHVRELKKQVEGFKATSPAAPPRAMAMQDKPQPVEPYIFVRGNQGRNGGKVPRQFLKVLSGPERKPFTKGSGRAELASELSSKQNPLTARVFVNRVWGHLMGAPMVDTQSDFGVRTAPPPNPELLDHLAASFMARNWSVKQLIREILLSATYQQQSVLLPAAAAKDPNNQLLWRMNPKRMDFEALRDSLLAVSGNADFTQFGKSVEIFTAPYSKRRSIYGFIDRQNLPGTFRTFDFASPDSHAPKRFETTVPQQALYLLNNPFVQEQAQKLTESIGGLSSNEEKARTLIRRVLSREASPEDITRAVNFVNTPTGSPQTGSAWSYGYGGWDAPSKVVKFTPYPHYSKSRWGGSEANPDPKIGWSQLGSDHGHPGETGFAAIRRWTAETTGTINLTGEVKLPGAGGTGILAQIVSNRAGLLGEWKLQPTGSVNAVASNVAVQAGDTIDFLVDCAGDTNTDSFHWIPQIKDATTGKSLANAKEDFTGPGPSPWQELAQALLCTNEFIFLD